jgi:hypothetical protein
MLKGGSGIDQAPIKEHPAGYAVGGGEVSQSERDGALSKSDLVNPRQGQAFAKHFFLDGAATGFLHGGVTASAEFNQER